MVSKVSAPSQVVPAKTTETKGVKQANNDVEVFEIDSNSGCSDTFKSSSSSKADNKDDGKISTGEFWTEYGRGMWSNLKKQCKNLINTAKEHPILSTIAVVGTITAAVLSPAVAGALGAVSLGIGAYELVKDAKNGIKAYKNYKNAKTDNDAKNQAREMGANTVNVAEDGIMMFFGARQLYSSAKKLLPKAIKRIKKIIKPPRFDLDKKIRLRVKRSTTDNVALIARVATCNSDDALNFSATVVGQLENNQKDKNKQKYSSVLREPPNKNKVKK